MRFSFILKHRDAVPLTRLCRLFGVSDRGYRAWLHRPASRKQRDDMVLLAGIREQHHLSLNSYGRPRMTQELKEQGFDVGERRVGRLMAVNGMHPVRTPQIQPHH